MEQEKNNNQNPRPQNNRHRNRRPRPRPAGAEGNKNAEKKPSPAQNQEQRQNQNKNQNASRGGQQHPQAGGQNRPQGAGHNRNRRRRPPHQRDRHTDPKPQKEFEIFESSSAEEILPGTSAPIEEETTYSFDGPADFLFDEPTPAPALPEEEVGERVEVIGVRFKKAGKIYYFASNLTVAKKGDFVIVETARGPEFGEVCLPNTCVPESEIVPPLRPVLRIATKGDIQHNADNQENEKEAIRICYEKIASHGLDMKLVEAKYTFDNSKLLFYFTSSGRVDFRDLVKDLASVFRTRIELRQIGIRDEAKLMGGLGICGRPLCCASFLSDFVQVSIKMAKEQNLSLNSTKISGSCGRLMCCLRYEHNTYEEEIRRTPPVDATVKTADGVGNIIEINPLAGTVRVRLTDKQESTVKTYHRDDVKVLSTKNGREKE